MLLRQDFHRSQGVDANSHPHPKSSCTAEAGPAPRLQKPHKGCTPAATLLTPVQLWASRAEDHARLCPSSHMPTHRAVGALSCTPAMAWRRQRPWESLKTHSHIDTKPPHQGSQEQPCALNQFKRQLLTPIRCKQHWLGLHSHLLWAHSEQPNPSVFSKREFSTWSSSLGTASSKTLPPQPCQACNGACRVSTSTPCASLPGITMARSRSPALELQAGE